MKLLDGSNYNNFGDGEKKPFSFKSYKYIVL